MEARLRSNYASESIFFTELSDVRLFAPPCSLASSSVFKISKSTRTPQQSPNYINLCYHYVVWKCERFMNFIAEFSQNLENFMIYHNREMKDFYHRDVNGTVTLG